MGAHIEHHGPHPIIFKFLFDDINGDRFILFFQIYARLWERDKNIQTANEKLMADLKESHRQLKLYAEKIADVVASEERNKLARDIHDSLGHYLAAINIQLSKARAFYDRDREESLTALENAKQAAAEAI